MTARDDHLVDVVVLAALGRTAALRSALADALLADVDEPTLREAILQVVPYAGFPRALSALETLAAVTGGPYVPAAGREDEPPEEGYRSRGEAVFREVWGETADPILDRIGGRDAEITGWLLTDAYGRVLGRRGLSLAEREILGVALLAALDQPDQLQGHLRGGLRVGAEPERLRAAVERAARRLPPEAAERALDRLSREVGGTV